MTFAIIITKQILFVLLVLLCFLGLGNILLRKFNIVFRTGVEKIFYSTVVGTCIAILYITVLGFAGIMYKPLLLLLLVGLVGLRSLSVDKKSATSFFILFLFALPTLMFTLNPPTHWDDISYHLPVAQSILSNHKIVFNPYVRYPAFPIYGEMLFVLGLAVNITAPQAMSWICMFLLAVGCFSELEKRYSKWMGFLGFTLVLSNQVIVSVGTLSYIDIILALFVTATILSFANYLQTKKSGWLYLAATLLGLSAGIKYTALVFCIILGGVLVLRKEWKLLWKAALIVFIIGIPWYIRNYYYAGNPIWPFLSSVFGYGTIWDPGDYVGQFNDFSSRGVAKTLLNFIHLPWYFSYGMEGGVNIIIWVGIAFWLFNRKNRTHDWFMFASLLVYTVFWFMSINLVRYYVPILPIACILSASGYSYVLEQFQDKKLHYALVAVLAIYNFSFYYQSVDKNHIPPTNSAEVEAYLANQLPTYKATKLAASLDGKTFGLFNENMVFYGQGKDIGDWFGVARYRNIVPLLNKPSQLHQKLVDLHVKYFLVNKAGLDPKIRKAGLHLGSQFHLLYEDNNAVLYSL